MKIRKKPAMVLSFALGSILFASTAFAEINSKSGYVQMKDALKYTAEGFSGRLSSYTADMSIITKDNGKIVSSEDQLMKFDVTKGAEDNKSTTINGSNEKEEGYSYSDKNSSITFDSRQGIYNVQKFETPMVGANFQNPFKEKSSSDIEKIADALIGNLKDSIAVNQNTDGTKQLTGTISEAQIPAIANALVSYEFKNQFSNSYTSARMGISKIVDDIYVKEIKGNMTLDKDGLVQTVIGTGVLSGKDEQGTEHKITFELLIKISDVNKTVVTKPDLTGKKVQTTTVNNSQNNFPKISKPEMYLGTYKSDIVIEKNSKFQKIGERFVDIISLDDKSVAGKYYEEYIKGNEEYSSKAKNFKFTTKFQGGYGGNVEATDSLGNKVNGYIDILPSSTGINFGIKEGTNEKFINDSQYSRVFK